MYRLLEELRNQQKKIGFTSGVFDLLHTGHIIMLQEAKAHCDYLVVGLLTDPTYDRPAKNFPVQSMFERFSQLQAVSGVDLVIPFDSELDLFNMLATILPSIRFVGEEYKNVGHTGKLIPGIEIFYNRRGHDFSSTELRNRKSI